MQSRITLPKSPAPKVVLPYDSCSVKGGTPFLI